MGMVVSKYIKHEGMPEELQLGTITCSVPGHEYVVEMKDSGEWFEVSFANGGRNQPDRTPGLDHQSLMIIIIDRIKYFKELFPNSTDNDRTLELLEEALAEMDARTIARADTGVLGNDGSDYAV